MTYTSWKALFAIGAVATAGSALAAACGGSSTSGGTAGSGGSTSSSGATTSGGGGNATGSGGTVSGTTTGAGGCPSGAGGSGMGGAAMGNQACGDCLNASFKWVNERWEIGLEIVENVIEVFECGLRKDDLHARRYFAKTASTCSSVANRPSAAS